jgi:FkbM family methyltransferase
MRSAICMGMPAGSIATCFLRFLIRCYSRLPIKPFRSSLLALFATYKKLYRGKQVIAQVDGVRYQLDLDELIDHSLFFDGAFEPMTAKALKQLTPRGATVLDIGANIGCHTCLLAKLAHPGMVIAFEPMPWARAKLLRNIALNSLSNVVVEKYVLADTNSKSVSVHFRSSWQLDSRTGLTEESSTSRSPAFVDLITVDSYVAEKSILNIGLIKLDVDGYEAKVLRGAAETLRKFHPILVMEFCSYTLEAAGDSLSDVIDLLATAGYRIYQEKTFLEFSSREKILESVPAGASINVVCSCQPLARAESTIRRASWRNRRANHARHKPFVTA